METQLPSPKGQSPQFSAHAYCGQTVGWIRITVGTEVGLGPDVIVLDGNPAPSPPRKGTQQHPTFWPMSVVAKWSPISASTELLLHPS